MPISQTNVSIRKNLMHKPDKNGPSIKLFLIMCVVYLFGTIPIFAGLAYFYKIFDISPSGLKTHLSEKLFLAQILLTILIVCYLWTKYREYLFGDNWKQNIRQYIITGLKWSIPVFIYHSFSLAVPSLREKLFKEIYSVGFIFSDGITGLGLLMFLCLILIGAINEEFLFRGILLKRMLDFFNSNVSLIFSSLIFALSHFLYSKIVPGNLISHFLIGMLCGVAFLSSRSCISSFLPHLSNNLICFLFIYTRTIFT